MWIIESLVEHASRRPASPALEHADWTLSYREVVRRTGKIAAGLAALGIRAGDMVGVHMRPSQYATLVMVGIARAGGVIVYLDEGAAARELEILPVRKVIYTGRRPETGEVEAILFDDVVRASRPHRNPERFVRPGAADGSDPLIVVSTSGSTGLPKHVALTHAQLTMRGSLLATAASITHEDRVALVPSLQASMGRRILFYALQQGAAVQVDIPPEINNLLDFYRRRRTTFSLVTPHHVETMLAVAPPEAGIVPGLRLMVAAGALSPEMRQDARRRITPDVTYEYGTNEVSMVTVATPADQDRHPASVGRALPGVEIQIVDDRDQPVPPCENGHLRVRVPSIPGGYVGNDDASGRFFRDGWYYPGDVGRLDAEGYLFLSGRSDDLISNHGVKFYPSEVEEAMRRNPRVREVCVLKRISPDRGEHAVALAVIDGEITVSEIQEHTATFLPRTMLPSWILVVKHLPRNAMGKVDRDRLRVTMEKGIAKLSARRERPE